MVAKSGFSIIELIVVVGLISLLGIAISAIMLASITSSNRVRTVTKIKQAGDHTITQLQTLVRNARAILSCTTPTQLTLQNPDGGQTLLIIELDSNGNKRVASGSGNFLTPEDLRVSTNNFITCSPSDLVVQAVTFSFDLENRVASTKSTEHPVLHFETTTELRND